MPCFCWFQGKAKGSIILFWLVDLKGTPFPKKREKGTTGQRGCCPSFQFGSPELVDGISVRAWNSASNAPGVGAGRLWRAAGLPRFPEFGLLSVLRLLKLFPQLPQAVGGSLRRPARKNRSPTETSAYVYRYRYIWMCMYMCVWYVYTAFA